MRTERILSGERSGLLKKIGYLSAVGILAISTMTACAQPRAQYTPYPPAGKTAVDYNRDIADCKVWAGSQAGASSQRALNEGVEGAVVLGLLGAVLGALAGDARLGGLAGAAIGATGGGMRGSQQAQRTYDYAYRDCLSKKGY